MSGAVLAFRGAIGPAVFALLTVNINLLNCYIAEIENPVCVGAI